MTALTRLLSPIALSLALVACDTPTPEADPTTPAEPTEAPPDQDPAARTPSPPAARVFFRSPEDGATVTSPLEVEFGIEGMAVVPAGNEVPRSGHHHLIVDAALPPLDAPIPSNEHYIHFGDGSTSTTLELSPGEHTLQLLLGDHRHFPHDPAVHSDVIKVVVAEGSAEEAAGDAEADEAPGAATTQ